MSEQQPKCRHCKKEILYDQLKKESYWNNILKLYKTLGLETSTAIEENRMKNKNITFVKFIKRNLTHTQLYKLYIIYSEKNLTLRLFSTETCLILTYLIKFNSNDLLTEKKPFWASFRYILINYIPEKVGIFILFVISWVFWVCVNDE